jgi:hypothetical protein
MTPNQGKTPRRLAAVDQGSLERGDLLHAMPSAALPDTTSALLREVAEQSAALPREAAYGIAADNLLTDRKPSRHAKWSGL